MSGTWGWRSARLAGVAAVLLGLSVNPGIRAQDPKAEPPAPAEGENPLAPPPAQVADLSTRYKFVERYARGSETDDPTDIGQYRVALKDAFKVVTDTPQGAPTRQEGSVQIILTERAASVSATGVVSDVIRRFDAVRLTPADPSPSAKRPLEGLAIWMHGRTGDKPFVTSLTPNRNLDETEFSLNGRVISMPEVATLLPSIPRRVGDTWRVSREAAIQLLAGRPSEGADRLVATLVDVKTVPNSRERQAIIGITGRVAMPPSGADTLLNAQVTFTFTPYRKGQPADPKEKQAEAPATGVVETRGHISEIRLAKSSTSAIPGPNPRLKRTMTHQLTLQRVLQKKEDSGPLAAKAAPPPDRANSWVTYHDPANRFSFQHPQDLAIDPRVVTENSVQLVDTGVGGFPEKVFTIELQAKTGDPIVDRNNLDPSYHARQLDEEWKADRREVLRGPSGWLPKADWSPYRMEVYRIEAAMKLPSESAPRTSERVFFDFYLIRTTLDAGFVVTSMTAIEPRETFRKEVEEMLRTLEIGGLKPNK